ncbi:MAG: hypothetical protein ACRC06_18480 [Waterburya sp.]
MMLAKFRQQYPQGSLLSELVDNDRGFYIVKVSLQVDNIILATALAGADRVETAEDTARERAIAALFLDVQPTPTNHHEAVTINNPTTPLVTSSTPSQPVNQPPIADSQQLPQITSQPPVTTPEISNEPAIAELELPITQATEPKISETPSPETLVIPNGNLFETTYEPEIAVDDSSLDNPPDISPNGVDVATANIEIEAIDFNEIKQKTDIEIKRLGWTRDDGREFLQTRYGKRSRLHLTDEQLLEFLRYLEKLPTPVK